MPGCAAWEASPGPGVQGSVAFRAQGPVHGAQGAGSWCVWRHAAHAAVSLPSAAHCPRAGVYSGAPGCTASTHHRRAGAGRHAPEAGGGPHAHTHTSHRTGRPHGRSRACASG